MFTDLDESLRDLLKTAKLGSDHVQIIFDPPTKDWAARRTSPTLSLYLADIRESSENRAANPIPVLNDAGQVIARRPADRYFRVTYAITAWASKVEDEHQLLGLALQLLVSHTFLPDQHCVGGIKELAAANKPVALSAGTHSFGERLATELWTAVGAMYKPAIFVQALLPVICGPAEPAGPPQTQPPVFKFHDHDTTAGLIPTESPTAEPEVDAPAEPKDVRYGSAPNGKLTRTHTHRK